MNSSVSSERPFPPRTTRLSAATERASPGSREHLFALDLARILTVALVISVHSLALGVTRISEPVGAFITVFHSSREIFFLITAFALTYAYSQREVHWMSFWRRRYTFVVPAYVAWSVIYFFADGKRLDPISSAASALGYDLLTGQARYHLYFLLVSMQIYLVFPLLRWLLGKTEGHHLALLLIAAAYEFALTYTIHDRHLSGGLLGAWLNNPDALLPSYLLYVVAGGLIAWHLDAVVSFTRHHLAMVLAVFVLGVGCGVGTYLAEIALAGQSPSTASAVFQPAIVVESFSIAWAFFAAGQLWADRGTPGRRLVAAGADGSFGIFLGHPLVLQGLLALGSATGALGAIRRAPVGLEIAALLLVGVPLIYGICGVSVFLLRHTPLSLVLTGRAATRPGPVSVKPDRVEDPAGKVLVPNASPVVAPNPQPAPTSRVAR